MYIVIFIVITLLTTVLGQSNPTNFIQATNLYSSTGSNVMVSNNSWTLLLNLPFNQSGYVRGINLKLNSALIDVRLSAIRIRSNGAATPQFGGFVGINIENLFGPGFSNPTSTSVSTDLYSDKFYSSYKSDQFVGEVQLDLPFVAGVSVEFISYTKSIIPISLSYRVDYSKGTAIDTTSLPIGKTWTMHAIQSPAPINSLESVSEAYVKKSSTAFYPPMYRQSNLEEQVLFRTNTPNTTSIMIGCWHMTQTSDNVIQRPHLSGSYKMYYDGVVNMNSFDSSSYYSAGYYFSNFNTSDPSSSVLTWSGVTKAQTTNLAQTAAYRFFPVDAAPQASNNLTFTWTSGSPGKTLSNSMFVQGSHTCMWYQQDAIADAYVPINESSNLSTLLGILAGTVGGLFVLGGALVVVRQKLNAKNAAMDPVANGTANANNRPPWMAPQTIQLQQLPGGRNGNRQVFGRP